MPIYNESQQQIFPALAPTGKVLNDYGQWVAMSGAAPPYAQSDVTNLVSDLAGKAPTGDGAAAVATHESAHSHALLHSNASDHSNANDPSAGEKAALTGTSGTPGSGNKYVTDGDARNTNARTPTTHSHAPGDVTGTAVITNDSRLSDARTPTAHNQDASTVNAGILDGDRLPALSSAQKGGCPATGTPSNKFLRDDATWQAPPAGTPAATVTGETTWGVSKVVGSSANYAREDHTHGTQADPVTRANGAPVYAALANDTLAQNYAVNSTTKLTVTAARTLTTTVPPAGCQAHTIILTSGTVSFVITFGTGFKPTTTLATGTVTARVFVVHWISDGTNLYESGRTAAMVA